MVWGEGCLKIVSLVWLGLQRRCLAQCLYWVSTVFFFSFSFFFLLSDFSSFGWCTPKNGHSANYKRRSYSVVRVGERRSCDATL